MPPPDHLLGWLVIRGNDEEYQIRDKVCLGLNSFVGDYGKIRTIEARGAFGFGLWTPKSPPPLTTWSLYKDADYICFVEGVFYDDYFSYQPSTGDDRQLATILLREFVIDKAKALENFSGSFSGFVYSYKNKLLNTFVDRLGTRPLYWTYENNDLIVSSNLASLRALKPFLIDNTGMFQFLTIGFPIGERTLLKDVRIQLPCSVKTFRQTEVQSLRYWYVPKRRQDMPLAEAAETIVTSVEDFVSRIYQRTRRTMALGLTGGHDSRLILSALAYKQVPFDAVSWNDHNFNDLIVPKLCALINKQRVITKDVSQSEVLKIKSDSFIYSQGSLFHSLGFSWLAKECFDHQIEYLILGFAGDRISGALTMPAPHHLRTLPQLATVALNNQMELLSFKNAAALLRNVDGSKLVDETLSEWLQSFICEKSHEDLSDMAIWQCLMNRNFKRISFAMAPGMQYAQLLFPFLDNLVMHSYFSLPAKFIQNQKAHCKAGFYRFRDFGNYQACGWPISLKREAAFPFWLYLLRLSAAKVKNLWPIRRLFRNNNEWSDYHKHVYRTIAQCDLYDSDLLDKLFVKKGIDRLTLYKLHELSMFYSFYETNGLDKELYYQSISDRVVG